MNPLNDQTDPGAVRALLTDAGLELKDASFADLTTLRIGGSPAAVVRCSTPDEVASVAALFDREGIDFLTVGGGSNLVVGDGDDVSRLVVLWTAGGENGVTIDTATGVVRAFAGVEWDALVAATVEAGLGGIECLSGIPGSVGATPVQNVGAYGTEVAHCLHRVRLFERATGEHRWVEPSELDLGYRYSNLKFTSRAVVTEVEFQLSTDGLSAPLRFGELARVLGIGEEETAPRRPVAQVREAVLGLRAGKGMVLNDSDHDTWSAGSFFTNPVVSGESARAAVRAAVRTRCGDEESEMMPCYAVGEDSYKFSAAWLIERAGFSKGWHVPGNERASLSTKHTLALTNRGTATSADIVELARAVRAGVNEAFGVQLEPEPIWVGASLD